MSELTKNLRTMIVHGTRRMMMGDMQVKVDQKEAKSFRADYSVDMRWSAEMQVIHTVPEDMPNSRRDELDEIVHQQFCELLYADFRVGILKVWAALDTQDYKAADSALRDLRRLTGMRE